MKMANEELPEYLIDSKTLENATWRLAVGLYQAQIKYNENKPTDKQLNLFSIEIVNQDGQPTGVITVTDLQLQMQPKTFHFSVVRELYIEKYQYLPSSSSSSPWTHRGEGLDTFFNLLCHLVTFQVKEAYNLNSNNFISLSITQSTQLSSYPFSVSATVTLPMDNVLDAKEFICTPKEVITGESPWKITTP